MCTNGTYEMACWQKAEAQDIARDILSPAKGYNHNDELALQSLHRFEEILKSYRHLDLASALIILGIDQKIFGILNRFIVFICRFDPQDVAAPYSYQPHDY